MESNCPCHPMKKKMIITLSFLRDALIYDIQNNSYVVADVMEKDDEHAKHQVYDIAEEGNIDRVTRTLDRAFEECNDLLYSFTKEGVKDIVQDNSFQTTECYKMKLVVPDTFAKGTTKLIEKHVHEYMVCAALEDWLSITHPEGKGNWREKKEDCAIRLKECINQRTKAVRRRMSVF